jgi:hypothetical protein
MEKRNNKIGRCDGNLFSILLIAHLGLARLIYSRSWQPDVPESETPCLESDSAPRRVPRRPHLP